MTVQTLTLNTTAQTLTINGQSFTISTGRAAGETGDFSGPASSTDAAFVRFDGTAGKTGQNSQTTEDDDGNVSVAGNIMVGGTVDGRDVATDGSKLDGVEPGATANTGALADLDTVANAHIAHDAAIALSKLAAMSAAGLLGATAAGAVAELTGTQATALLDEASGSAKGLLSTTLYNLLTWLTTQYNAGNVSGAMTLTSGDGHTQYATQTGAASGALSVTWTSGYNQILLVWDDSSGYGGPDLTGWLMPDGDEVPASGKYILILNYIDGDEIASVGGVLS